MRALKVRIHNLNRLLYSDSGRRLWINEFECYLKIQVKRERRWMMLFSHLMEAQNTIQDIKVCIWRLVTGLKKWGLDEIWKVARKP